MAGNGNNIWNNPIFDDPNLNSPMEYLERGGIRIIVPAHITGNNDTYKIPVFKLTKSVRVVDQYAEIDSITNLTNMTDVHADLWADTGGAGTIIDTLTADSGANLSGLQVGSWFTKDKEAVEPYSIVSSITGSVHEVGFGDDIGRPFIVTQRYGVDTYIRFCYTTNTILDFYMTIFFKWQPLNSGILELVT
jgi:hypothetical protein